MKAAGSFRRDDSPEGAPAPSLLPSAAPPTNRPGPGPGDTVTNTATIDQPRAIATGCPDLGVYVACLASYNAGRLYGAWVDLEACHDLEALNEAIAWVLKTSPAPDAEEWAIHDGSGLPRLLSRNEWPDLADLISYAETWRELPTADEAEAYAIACDDQGEILSADAFRDCYRGCYRSGEDYAQELAEECSGLPAERQWPLSCIDWEAAWRELTFDGYREERCSSGGVHIFCPA